MINKIFQIKKLEELPHTLHYTLSVCSTSGLDIPKTFQLRALDIVLLALCFPAEKTAEALAFVADRCAVYLQLHGVQLCIGYSCRQL